MDQRSRAERIFIGGRVQRIMCANAHYECKTRNTFRQGSKARLRALEALYRVSQKSGTADFQYLAGKTSSAEENDTKIIKFGWVIFKDMPTSWTTVIFKFRLVFATDERRIVSGKASIRCFGEAHWSVATKETRINGLPQTRKSEGNGEVWSAVGRTPNGTRRKKGRCTWKLDNALKCLQQLT